jgi:DnaK suppressor protein
MKAKFTDVVSQLNGQREELADRLARLDRHARRETEPLVADFAEQATQRENDEVVDRLRETTKVELGKVTAALRRLADGSYGQCERCGSPIEEGRLRALPHTSVCLSCVDPVPELRGGN